MTHNLWIVNSRFLTVPHSIIVGSQSVTCIKLRLFVPIFDLSYQIWFRFIKFWSDRTNNVLPLISDNLKPKPWVANEQIQQTSIHLHINFPFHLSAEFSSKTYNYYLTYNFYNSTWKLTLVAYCNLQLYYALHYLINYLKYNKLKISDYLTL